MLLSDIITDAADQLGEVVGSEGYRNPAGWLAHVTRTMDEMCRKSRCLYETFRAPVTAGQAQVGFGPCASCPIFDIEEARITLADGTVSYLQLSLPQWARWSPLGWQVCADVGGFWGWGAGGFDWRDALPYAYPSALAVGGINDLRLFPAPNYSDAFTVVNGQNVYTTRSLAITGYAVPVPPPNQDGTARADWLESDTFPLNDRFADCVIEGAKWRRMQTYRKIYAPAEIAMQRDLYDRQLALLVSESRGGLTGAGRVIGAYA